MGIYIYIYGCFRFSGTAETDHLGYHSSHNLANHLVCHLADHLADLLAHHLALLQFWTIWPTIWLTIWRTTPYCFEPVCGAGQGGQIFPLKALTIWLCMFLGRFQGCFRPFGSVCD
jgi:hypothetical protein